MSRAERTEDVYRLMDRLLMAGYAPKKPEKRPPDERGEAARGGSAYKRGGGEMGGAGITVPVNITVSGMTVRETADVDKIAAELVRRIKRAGELMPNI